MRKVKYLNNRDLLKQISISKNTFSSYTADEYSQFDIILPSLEKVNRLTVAEAKRNRADRIGKLAYEQARESGDKKTKLAEVTPDWRKVAKTDLIFRIMLKKVFTKKKWLLLKLSLMFVFTIINVLK